MKGIGKPKIIMKFKKSGFTLLELLIVVAILAILVALAMPFFQDYLAKSRITAAQSDLTSYQKALASFDQLESKMFSSGLWSDLIGRYLQDFRAFATQPAPLDPWNNPYQIHVASGTILSVGPNGTKETTGRNPLGDDLVVTWKPEFFLIEANKVGDDKMDVSFTRKIETIGATDLSTDSGLTSTSVLKISDTVYRFTLDDNLPAGEIIVTAADDAIVAQDGKRLLASDLKPDGVSPANIATFTP